MKNFKKLLALLLCVAMIFVMAACSSSEITPIKGHDDDDDDNDKKEEAVTEAEEEEEEEEDYEYEAETADSTESEYEDDSIYWDLSGGVLTISGNGAMPDFAYDEERPWEDNTNSVYSIVIEEGITRVGSYAFASCYNCSSITLPTTLDSIGTYAFNACGDVTTLEIPEGVKTIEKSAFQSCWAVDHLSIPSTITTIEAYAFSFFEELSTVYTFAKYCDIDSDIFFDCAEGFTLYCLEGSDFEDYAKSNGIEYYTAE